MLHPSTCVSRGLERNRAARVPRSECLRRCYPGCNKHGAQELDSMKQYIFANGPTGTVPSAPRKSRFIGSSEEAQLKRLPYSWMLFSKSFNSKTNV
eukprot:612815-Amphidinium_carterae.1